jgi:5-(aminomethyl)-3-furanmethanol phosphate kinase
VPTFPENAPIIVKLGGSHAFSQHLTAWLDALLLAAGSVVIVPGGGPFADAVRTAQPEMRFDDRAAHRMALLAMEQFGCALVGLRPSLTLAESAGDIRAALRAAAVPVWTPTRMILEAKDVPWSWDVTSDSLAAWLAGTLGAKLLLLVKSSEAPRGPVPAGDLAASGIVDPLFPRFLATSGAQAYLAGPSDHAAFATAVRCGEMVGAKIECG